MKTISLAPHRARAGFTLVELLVVIAIIATLAAMLLPVLESVQKHAKIVKAQTEESTLATAIQNYDSAYGRFPLPSASQSPAVTAAINAKSDFTYGGVFNSGSGTSAVDTFSGSGTVESNAEVIAILMDITNTTVTAVNANHQKNPQQTIFLSAKMSGWDSSQGGTPQPGVGNDLVYRDPWGNPYVITMDLNFDEQCSDSFYSTHNVSFNSASPNPQAGFNGLSNPNAGGSGDNFLYHGKVMVWSAGPDGKIDPISSAATGFNKDNVLSWK